MIMNRTVASRDGIQTYCIAIMKNLVGKVTVDLCNGAVYNYDRLVNNSDLIMDYCDVTVECCDRSVDHCMGKQIILMGEWTILMR